MKKIWRVLYGMEDIFAVIGYLCYFWGVLNIVSTTLTWSWSWGNVQSLWYTFVMGWLCIQFAKKIVDKNTIPYHPTKITSDDDLPTTEDDSLEQYLLADYLINQHNESHSNDDSDKNI